MCLFNPQLDIYSFQKHFRDDFPVITTPISLHSHHRDGFPWMIAFENGERVHSSLIHPYEERFRSLCTKLWKDDDITLRPASPLHLATRFIYENDSRLALFVCSDGDTAAFESVKEKSKNMKCITVKYENQLTGDDFRKNLMIKGVTEKFNFEFFEWNDIPVKITRESIQISDYEFPKSYCGLHACFPNPFNRERYIVLDLRGKNLKTGVYENCFDYIIYRDGAGDNDQDGFYRLYGKHHDGRLLSDGILISGKGPIDVITPAVAFNDHGEMLLAWCEWKANYRFLKYRTIENRILGEILTVQTKRTENDYTNAWCPSLVLDDGGTFWGAWNQHYPAILGVCAGDLLREAKAVDDNGGYPSIVLDHHRKL